MPLFEGLHVEHLALSDINSVFFSDSPDATVDVKVGEIVAICGPSNSGKSALLHILAGSNLCKNGAVCHGQVNIRLNNMTETKRCCRCWYKHVRMVPHKDLFVSSLTCKETTENYSKLSSGASFDFGDDDLFDNTLINHLESRTNLEACAKLKILSVMSALTSGPAILLIDEPLTTFEQKTMLKLGRLLRHFTQDDVQSFWTCKHCRIDVEIEQRCVVLALNSTLLTIEAEDYLNFINKFLFLSKSKQIIFYGTIDEALRRLRLQSTSDLVSYLENTDRDLEPNLDENKHLLQKSIMQLASNSSVLKALFIRHYLQIKNIPKHYLRVIIERVLIFTLLAFIFQNPNSRSALLGLYFFLPINQTSNVILFTSSESFSPNELVIIERDRFHQLYHSWNIATVKYMVLSFVNVMPSLVYLPVIFYVSAIVNRSSFPIFILANFLNILCSCAVGIFIAASSKDVFVRNLWLFGLSTVFATFGGIHTAANYQLPWTIRWIQYLSPTFYLFLILIRLEFNDVEIRDVLSLGKFILSTGEAFAALAGLTLAYIICALVALHRSTMPRRLLF